MKPSKSADEYISAAPEEVRPKLRQLRAAIMEVAPDAVESIRLLSGDNRLKRETYIDIFSGRSFREALLVRGGRTAEFSPSPGSTALESLHFIPALDLQLDGDVQRLQSAFINGVKHIPVTFSAGPRVSR